MNPATQQPPHAQHAIDACRRRIGIDNLAPFINDQNPVLREQWPVNELFLQVIIRNQQHIDGFQQNLVVGAGFLAAQFKTEHGNDFSLRRLYREGFHE